MAGHKYISQAALELRLTPRTLAAIFDDTGDGVVNTAAVDAVIDDAEAEVEGLLGGQYAFPLGDLDDIPLLTVLHMVLSGGTDLAEDLAH